MPLFRRLSIAAIPAVLTVVLSIPCNAQLQQEEVRGAPAEPSDAAETRAAIAQVEKLKSRLPDRGAVFYFLAAAHRHLGETLEALRDLKDCTDLEEGFDPSGGVEFLGLEGTHDFDSLVEKIHEEFPAVSHAHPALWDEERDLIPGGLAWDARKSLFYLSSLNLKKIVQLTPESHASDFVPAGRDHLLPVRGIRVAPLDDSVWAASSGEEGKSELLHFGPSGKLLGRFSPQGPGPHGFHDLVITTGGAVLISDTTGDAVLRFEPGTKSFSKLALDRPLFSPRGIALDEEHHLLFVADALGVVRLNLSDGSSQDVDPGHHNTLAGADGLYWHEGSLIAIQNGIGAPRIAVFKLSRDATSVTRARILEYRTSLVSSPTTGAIRGSDFYFISNSHADNLLNGKISDPTQLEEVRIAVVSLR
jgi:hypothetical protein